MSEALASMTPQIFETRKNKILAELSVPEDEYSDLSPKGSIDEGIQDLIHDINTLPGLVTTSSCAGRISVFLEGRKRQNQDSSTDEPRQFVSSGGKGAGRWLYVSHAPLSMSGSGVDPNNSRPELERGKQSTQSLHEMFGMIPGDGKPPGVNRQGQAPRLVRFHFEPMILHIMTATLHHAQPVLSAASSAGFRESGLQSLRCLDADDGPSPVVAVRSTGLSLESVIGYCEDDSTGHDDCGTNTNKPAIRSLVTEEYLKMLVDISNERFSINSERKERFRRALLAVCSTNNPSGMKIKGKARPADWEDPEARRERKREEGLRRKALLENQTEGNVDCNTKFKEEV